MARKQETGGRYEVRLDGNSLCDLDPRIEITDIRETVRENTTNVQSGRYDGLTPLMHMRESLDVTVCVHLRTLQPQERRGLFSRICAWAGGSCLSVSLYPNRLLYGAFEPPVMPGPEGFDELELTFRAFDFPYWQEAYPQPLVTNGTSFTQVFSPSGTTDYTFLEFRIVNQTAAPLTWVQIETHARGRWISYMAFSELSLLAGEELILAYDDCHRLHISCKGQDGNRFRSAESSDELILLPEETNQVVVTLNTQCRVELTARGVYR